jgi:biopolymer transport protein ExbB
MTSSFHAKSLTTLLVNEAQNELELSAGSEDNEGIKERTGFRLERRVAAVGRHMGRGNGYLATIGAISPFVGLFGTVWGIMNSFIGIAQTKPPTWRWLRRVSQKRCWRRRSVWLRQFRRWLSITSSRA